MNGMLAVAGFFAWIVLFLQSIFAPFLGGGTASLGPDKLPSVDSRGQAAAAALQFLPQAASAPAAAPAPDPTPASATTTAPAPPQTIINNNPVIKPVPAGRQGVVVQPTPQEKNGTVSPFILATLLAQMEQRITGKLNNIVATPNTPPPISQQVAAAGNSLGYSFAPASQRIDQLNNTSVSNPTITGGSISNTSIAGYLPLSGGTLSGNLSGTNLNLSGALTAGALNVASIASAGALTGPYVTSTSTTATSTFAGPVAFSSIPWGLLSTNANGSVVATTSIGVLNGTSLVPGTTMTITAASSTLLANNNTFSSNNSFSASTTFSNLINVNQASTTNLTTSGSTWLTNLAASSILALDNNKQVIASSTIGWNLLKGPASSIFAFDNTGNPIATTSIGVNYLSGIFPIANGGTNNSSGGTTGGLTYFDGTKYANNSLLTYAAAAGTALIGTTTASQTLLMLGTSTASQLALSDNAAGDNLWTMRSVGNYFYLATSTATATSSTSAFWIDKNAIAYHANGFVSQASSTVVGNLTVTGNGIFPGTTGTTTIASGQGFTIGGSQFVMQQGSGNVGIGTTSPATLFSAAGSGYFTGGLGVGLLNTTSGTLQTSGNATVGGNLSLNGLLSQSGVTTANPPTIGINSAVTMTGTPTSTMPGTWTFTDYDTVNAGAGNWVQPFTSIINFNGSSGTGNRQAITTQTYVTNGRGTGNFYGGAQETGWLASGSGQMYGNNPYVLIASGVGAGTEAVGEEVDTDVRATSNIARKVGLQVVDISTSVGSSSNSNLDDALLIGQQSGAVGYANGIMFGQSSSLPGVKSTGTLINTASASFANGINLSNATITGNAFASPGFVVTGAGNVGIGTTSPSTILHVSKSAPAASSDIINENTADGYAGLELKGNGTLWLMSKRLSGDNNRLGFYYNNGSSYSSELLTLTTGGNVGIGTTSPDMLLSVGSATPVGNVAHFENSTGSCYINPTTTSLSCSSDARLKTNINPLASSTLDALLSLNPVTYNWKTESATSSPHTGFIAQEVQQVFPDLISQGPDGYYTLNYAGLTPYLTKAVQEIATISGTFKVNLIAWLGDSANGIDKLFAKDVYADNLHGNQLCLTDAGGTSCYTRSELDALLQGKNLSQTDTLPPSTAPLIQINGNATSTINVGDTYADLGARITAPQADLNLDIMTTLDGATTTAITIDTTQPGTHTIFYTVTDPRGLTGSAIRTVVVAPNTSLNLTTNPFLSPATSTTPANDNASTTAIN